MDTVLAHESEYLDVYVVKCSRDGVSFVFQSTRSDVHLPLRVHYDVRRFFPGTKLLVGLIHCLRVHTRAVHGHHSNSRRRSIRLIGSYTSRRDLVGLLPIYGNLRPAGLLLQILPEMCKHHFSDHLLIYVLS